MTVKIDTTYALRGHAAIAELVGAVLTADEHDETDWLEWKSTLDLTTKPGIFAVAKAVLGLANRTPDRAGRICEGTGYVVAGAAPGNAQGVTTKIDPADLSQSLEAYLGGARGPRYTTEYVNHADRWVLVITVDAPRAGDPAYPLRKEYTKPGGGRGFSAGTVFVRKHGRTVPADADDIDALSARASTARRASPSLAITSDGTEIPWFVPSDARAAIDRWAAAVAARRAETARHRDEQLRHPKPSAPLTIADIGRFAEAQKILRGITISGVLAGGPDERTLDEYLADLDKWKTTISAAVDDQLPGAIGAEGLGLILFTAHNDGPDFLDDLEVVIEFEHPALWSAPSPPAAMPPLSAPARWGAATGGRFADDPFDFRVLDVPAKGYLAGTSIAPVRRTHVDEEERTVAMWFQSLRPRTRDTGRELFCYFVGKPDRDAMTCRWWASARNLDVIAEGEVSIPFAEDPVDVVQLLTEADLG